jgi:hypothetical protein
MMTRAGLLMVLADLRAKLRRHGVARSIIERTHLQLSAGTAAAFAQRQLDRIQGDEQRTAREIAEVEAALQKLPSDC